MYSRDGQLWASNPAHLGIIEERFAARIHGDGEWNNKWKPKQEVTECPNPQTELQPDLHDPKSEQSAQTLSDSLKPSSKD